MQNLIPEQISGNKFDYFKTTEFINPSKARDFYILMKKRLLDINNWNNLTDVPSASFCLLDVENRQINGVAKEGDYVRIDIPGPGLPSSEGYDWVCIESITYDETENYQRTVLTLRPASDPTNTNPDTAHFLKASATSTILIEQKHNTVLAQYAGRNEVTNTDNKRYTDNIRNFLVGMGAKMGASFPQWKALIAGIIKRAEDKN